MRYLLFMLLALPLATSCNDGTAEKDATDVGDVGAGEQDIDGDGCSVWEECSFRCGAAVALVQCLGAGQCIMPGSDHCITDAEGCATGCSFVCGSIDPLTGTCH